MTNSEVIELADKLSEEFDLDAIRVAQCINDYLDKLKLEYVAEREAEIEAQNGYEEDEKSKQYFDSEQEEIDREQEDLTNSQM